ncbi:MAG TPA: hypothetical protein VGK23_05105 [Methanomassiliicoccales archaeon]|jgi:hypothetical protein
MAPISFKSLFTGPEDLRSEAARMEPGLLDSLSSFFPGERRRAEARVLKVAETEPRQMVTVLLRFYDQENEKVRESVRSLMGQIVQTRAGREAIIDNVSNMNRDVRRGVKLVIQDIWGPQAVPYASLYEQTLMLIGFARKKEVPVDDIERLAITTKSSFMEGETVRAIADISHCLDLVKLRYRNVETLKNYLAEMLRTIPELNRRGVPTERMEESLRAALTVSRNRRFDYTTGLIDDRMRELEIRDELIAIGEVVKANVTVRPEKQISDLNGMDVWAFEKMSEIIQMTMASNLTDSRSISLKVLHGFLMNEFSSYYENNAKARIARQDASALFTVYVIGLVSLKLVSDLIPVAAEDTYQRYYRGIERDPSILLVTWPEVVMLLAK